MIKLKPYLPIAIYDSGRGAEAVANEIKAYHPQLPLVIFKDSECFPYGKQSPHQLKQRVAHCLEIIKIQNPNLQAIIFACHTTSNIVLPLLSKHYPIPLLGMLEPTCKALAQHKLSTVIWLATSASIQSQHLPKMAAQSFRGTLIPLACNHWVKHIENKSLSNQAILDFIHDTFQKHPDIQVKLTKPQTGLLLGCTHFSHWKYHIQTLMPKKKPIIDPQMVMAKTITLSQEPVHI